MTRLPRTSLGAPVPWVAVASIVGTAASVGTGVASIHTANVHNRRAMEHAQAELAAASAAQAAAVQAHHQAQVQAVNRSASTARTASPIPWIVGGLVVAATGAGLLYLLGE